MRTTGSPEVLEYRRRLAIERIQDGFSTQEVAEFLGAAPSTVRRWLAAFRRRGGAALESRPVPGRPPKLTGTQEKIVRRWLADDPTEHGFATELWTAPHLAQFIEQEWGIHFHPDSLGRWLRRRGFTPQKPRRKVRARDDEAIARWLEEDWPRIKKGAAAARASIPLLDESGLLMAPLVRCSWAPRGHPSVLKRKARHREKVSVAAAIWLTPRRNRLGLAYQTLVDGYFTNEEVADFLQTGLEGLAEPLIVVRDRGGPHSGDPLRALLAGAAPRLDLEPLPPHAPELMPVEFLWRWLKYDRLCNFAPQGAHHLNEVVVRELVAIRDDQGLLRPFFQLSDLPLPRALL